MTADRIDMPFGEAALRRSDELRSRFQSGDPLPGFVVVEDFLAPHLLDVVLEGLRQAAVATHCSYSITGNPDEIEHGFHEPNPDYYYVTVHQRPTHEIPALDVLRGALGTPEAVRALSGLCGVPLRALMQPDALTCWGPGSFIAPHTDFEDRRKRLVVSLSLTERWSPAYGGRTTFAWKDLGRSVEMTPKLNTAVLFEPHPGSTHWVDQVLPSAPPRTRFTWTLFYQ